MQLFGHCMKNHAWPDQGGGKQEEKVTLPCLAGGKWLLESFLVLLELFLIFIFSKICLKKNLLGCGRMQNNTFFFNENLFFFNFLFLKFRRKTIIFNIRSLSYNVSLQPDIMQNYWKNMWGGPQIFLKWPSEFLEFFKIIMIILLYYY